jgi:ElaB/YqjD/DUF883 family membrane-anchored ribosome-binding protein
MQGKILDYNTEFKSGLIRGEDGNKYRFSIDDCKSDLKPRANVEVDFEANSDKAVEIYVMTKDTLDDVKDVASSAINATAYAAKVGADKSKKFIPIFFGLIIAGALVIGVIVLVADQSQKQKYAEQLDQERQQINSIKNEYTDLTSKANQLMQSKDCVQAEKILQDANQKLSTNPSLTDENQWTHKYDLAECYLSSNKPMKALSIIENPPTYDFDEDPNFWQNFIYSQSTKEEKALRYKIASKAFKLEGDSRSSKKYAHMACENGDCTLVEK